MFLPELKKKALDSGGADGNLCYVVCDEAEVWTVYGEAGTCADGGAGD